MIKVIHDILTDTFTEVQLTAEELTNRQSAEDKHKAEQAERLALEAKAAADKAALLAKLGITQEEASLLLS